MDFIHLVDYVHCVQPSVRRYKVFCLFVFYLTATGIFIIMGWTFFVFLFSFNFLAIIFIICDCEKVSVHFDQYGSNDKTTFHSGGTGQ